VTKSTDTAKLEKRVVRIAVLWAKIGKGWMLNSDGKPTDFQLAVKLENAVADLTEARRKRKERK
jgi:hypothetical protein